MAEEEEIMTTEKEMMSTTLPHDIIIEILSWLPANSLVNSFKFVCKPWRTSIHDPAFVKLHFSRGATINGGVGGRISSNNHSLICKSGNELFQLHPPFNFEGVPPSVPATQLDFDLLESVDWVNFGQIIDFDSSSLSLNSRLVGSCNGLLCLSFNDDENIILLNPSTRKYKLPPKQLIETSKDRRYGPATFGFGCCYNSSNNNNTDDEYKVIRMVYSSGFEYTNLKYQHRTHYQIDIYWMSSNSWRRETRHEDYPYLISYQQSGVFVNGALHWVARYTQTRAISGDSWDTIISFNIKDEEFGLVPIPLSCHPTDDDPEFNMHEVILMNMKGCLSMIRYADVHNNHIDIDLEIWVMKEYGIQESWTEEFVIRSSDSYPPRVLSDFTICSFSNAYVLKGDQILIQGKVSTSYNARRPPSVKLILFDINERKIDGDFKRIGVPVTCVDQVDYIERLVSLKSSLTSIKH